MNKDGGHKMRIEDMQRLFELSLDMVGIAGFDGYFKVLNGAFEKTLGFTAEELTAVPYAEFIHPDDIESTYRAAAGLTQAHDAVLFRNRYRCKDGSYRWLEWNSTAYIEESLIYFVTRDVTERKRLEQKLKESVEQLTSHTQELSRKNEALVAEIAERQRTEEAFALQQRTIQAMSTPIIKAWDGVLVLPMVGRFDTARAAGLMERLLTEIVASAATFAILDLTGADDVDATIADHILTIGRAVALLGSRCLLSGISPATATAIIQTGTSMGDIKTFGQLQDALRHALGTLEGTVAFGRSSRPARK